MAFLAHTVTIVVLQYMYGLYILTRIHTISSELVLFILTLPRDSAGNAVCHGGHTEKM